MHHHLMFAKYHCFFYIVPVQIIFSLHFSLSAFPAEWLLYSFHIYFLYIFLTCLYLSFPFAFFGFPLFSLFCLRLMWLIFPFIIAPKSENNFNWNVSISQGRNFTVPLPKSCQLWFPSVRFRFFHSANIHTANIVSHCSNTGEKIAKCNSIILWWRKKYFLSYMSSEFLVLFNFFSTRTVVCDSFQMELHLQSFKSLFCFVFVLLDFAIYVWCCCLQ